MDPESWREVRAVFDELVELPPDQRAERLAVLGATDPGLRDSVAALLTADSQAEERLGEVEATLLPPPSASPISTPARDPFGLSGRTLAHFRIVEPLGVGGMGLVYRAQDLRLNRTVALKVPLPGYRLEPSAKQRFLHEARSAAALDHPNLCSIYEVGESEEGHPFLAMPLYPGETLKERLAREGQLPVAEAVEIARQVAEGLAAAHGAGIVHRDVKPGNVMLLPNGAVKILDFGLAKVRDLTLTGSRAQLGTVAYMAPEQIRREPSDGRTDLWALGVVLYEMLTGRRPFEGEHEISVAHAIVHEEPLRPSALRGEIPRPLEGLLRTLLRKEPASRPASAQQVAAELSALQSGRALPVRRALAQGWTAATGWRGDSGRPRATGVLLVAGLAGVALLGALTAGGADTPLLMFRASGEAPAPAVSAPARTAVAVLPFVNLSAEGEHAYVAAALHTELLTQLSQVAALTVISRTSVIAYQGTSTPLKQIARELGVGSVLEGSVQVLNGRLRVNVQLIDAATDAHLWANRYDRPLEDAFAIQSEIARRIAEALQAHLTPDERRRLEVRPTQSLTAYDLYLRGRDYFRRYKPEENQIAIGLFRRAIAMDPTFALAWAGLADAFAAKLHRFSQGREWRDSAFVAAERAVSLDPDLAEARKALGHAYLLKGEWTQGIAEYERALVLNPGYTPVINNLAVHRAMTGELDEALRLFRRAAALTPHSVDGSANVAYTYAVLGLEAQASEAMNTALALHSDSPTSYQTATGLLLVQGRFAEAREQVERLLAMEGDNARSRATAGDAYLFDGDLVRAREHLEQAYALSPDSRPVATMRRTRVLLGATLWRMGERQRARQLFAEYEEIARDAIAQGDPYPFHRYGLAAVHALQGRRPEAMQWLEQAFSVGFVDYWLLLHDPLLENLRGTPEFQQYATRVKARVDQQRARVQQMEQP